MMKEQTNIALWLVVSATGKRKIAFPAGSLAEVRQKAKELGGVRYRYVSRIPEGSPMHDKYRRELGL